jgi:hypothetical protein
MVIEAAVGTTEAPREVLHTPSRFVIRYLTREHSNRESRNPFGVGPGSTPVSR